MAGTGPLNVVNAAAQAAQAAAEAARRAAEAAAKAAAQAAAKAAAENAAKAAQQSMQTDAAQLSSAAGQLAAPDGALPWEPSPDVAQALKLNFRNYSEKALEALKAMDLKKPDVRPYFDETCVVATLQQQWAELHPEQYAETRDAVAEPPYELNVPNPEQNGDPKENPVVTLNENDVQFLEEQEAKADPPLTQEQRAEMYMQYALMKMAAQNGGDMNAAPETIASGTTDAADSDGLDENGLNAQGLDDHQMSIMTNAVFGADSPNHINRHALQGDPELAAQRLGERAGVPGGTTVTVDNGYGNGHAVIVEEKPQGSGEYYMRDSEGTYPRGDRAAQYPQPMTQEQVVELMALDQDLGDSAGRGSTANSGGSTTTYAWPPQ